MLLPFAKKAHRHFWKDFLWGNLQFYLWTLVVPAEIMMMMMMMVNCFYGIVDRRKSFSLISSRDHCQRSSPSRISDTPRAGFEPAQSLSSGLIEWSCTVVITTTLRRHRSCSREIILSMLLRGSCEWDLVLRLRSFFKKIISVKNNYFCCFIKSSFCTFNVSMKLLLKSSKSFFMLLVFWVLTLGFEL